MRVRAATLNVWALPEPVGNQVTPRMRAIGERLASLELDFVAFQEVWTAQARHQLLDAGRRAGLPYAWHKRASLGGSGLLVLSRLPIQATHFERFALPGLPSRLDHPDYYGGKGFVRLRIATPAGPLSFIDTHLQARYANDVDHEYESYRVGQVVQLATGILATREPLIVAGDLNFEEHQPEYQVLRGLSGVQDVAVRLGQRDPTAYKGNVYKSRSSKPDRRIDYLFARAGLERGLKPLQVRRVFDEALEIDGAPANCSDHAGVWAEFELAGAGSPLPPVDPEAVRLASRLLAVGHARAERRQRQDRTLAGAGLATALLASAGRRSSPISRRRLLRGAVQAAGLLALTPGVGYSLLSEVYAPDELRAFERLAALLESSDPGSIQFRA